MVIAAILVELDLADKLYFDACRVVQLSRNISKMLVARGGQHYGCVANHHLDVPVERPASLASR